MAVLEGKGPLLTPSARNAREAPATDAPAAGAPIGRALLRIPLFYKLVLANSAIALVAVLVCATLVARAVRADPAADTTGILLPIALAAVVLGVVFNAIVVRLALTPLRNLEKAAEQVRAGSEDARAVESAVSDAAIEGVVQTFNSMLDSVALYRQRLREIAIRALDAGEAERKRISRELHDDIAQSLAAVLVQLRLARANSGATQDAQLEQVGTQLTTVIDDVRGIAQQLRPPALDMLGLGAAVLAHARRVSETTGLRVDARVDGILDGTLSAEAELALYRLIQEALLNVVRHGATDLASVKVQQEGNAVVAEISDFGRGFELEPTLAKGALGLLGMYERATYVGGQVRVKSTPGHGTTVRIELPVKEKANV